MASSKRHRFKGTTEQVYGSLNKLPGRHRPSSRTEEMILLRKAYPEKFGAKAQRHSFNKTRKNLGRSLQPLSNTVASSRPTTSYKTAGNQSQTRGLPRTPNMRPHTVGDIGGSSSRRLGTGSSTLSTRRPGAGYNISLRPGTSTGASLLQVDDYINMQNQCATMQQRLERLETALEEGELNKGKDKPKSNDDEGGVLPTHLGIRFNQMEGVLDRLETVFLDRDELMRLHWRMATKINSVIRRFLAYKRFKQGKEALSRWRQRVALPFLNLIDKHVDRQTALHVAENTIKTNLGIKLIKKCIIAWYKYTLKKLPSNREKIRKALEMAMLKSSQLELLVFSAWKRCAQGRGSRKNVALSYKKRLIDARIRIKQSGKVDGVVTREALKKEMRADATRRIRRRKVDYIKLRALYGWQEVTLEKNYRLLRIAKQFYFQKYVAPCFYAWQNYINQLDLLGAARKSLRIPRFRPRYNMDAVTLFYRRNTLAKVLKRWSKYAHPRAVVRRHLEATATLQCSKVVKVWASRTRWQIRTKRYCVDEWRDYAKRICSAPFMAWFLWKEKRRTRATASTAIVSAFKRRQTYRKVYQIFRLWKHLSIYGKAEGLKSRIALLRALDQQNKFARQLEGTIDQLEDEVESTELALTEQENANHSQLQRQHKLEAKCEKYKFALHGAEQEIARLQTLMDSLRKIYPATVDRVEGHQTREATLMPFSRKRAKDTVSEMPLNQSPSPPPKQSSRGHSPGERRKIDRNESGDTVKMDLEVADLDSTAKASQESSEYLDGTFGASHHVRATFGVSPEDMAILRRARMVLGEFNLLPDSPKKEDHAETLGKVQQDMLRFIGGTNPQLAGAESKPLLTPMAEQSTWNDFLQDLNMHHPMKHPLNSTAKDRIQTRIAHAKYDSRINYDEGVNIYSRAGFQDEDDLPSTTI